MLVEVNPILPALYVPKGKEDPHVFGVMPLFNKDTINGDPNAMKIPWLLLLPNFSLFLLSTMFCGQICSSYSREMPTVVTQLMLLSCHFTL